MVHMLGSEKKNGFWISGFSVEPDRNMATAYSGNDLNGGNLVAENKHSALEDSSLEEHVGCGVIQFNECNTVLGKLKCGMKFDIVVDIGASLTLIM